MNNCEKTEDTSRIDLCIILDEVAITLRVCTLFAISSDGISVPD